MVQQANLEFDVSCSKLHLIGVSIRLHPFVFYYSIPLTVKFCPAAA
jgi:hypothetical protein